MQHAPEAPDPIGLRAAATAEEGIESRRDWKDLAARVLHFLVAIFLFILAIKLMTTGAKEIGPRIVGTFPFDNAVSTLGLGWLGAYLVLSGSPIAATAIAFFAAGTLTRLQVFTMLSGSRLGASFIVLLVGFLYAMKNKGRRRQESIGMGVLALSMTAVVYIPGMLVGYGILKSGFLSGVHWAASSDVNSVIDYVWGPVITWAQDVLASPFLFPLGLGVILVSFKLLDRVLPAIDGDRHAHDHWLKKPWPMFFLGSLAALLTLSVSVAITVLVPLAAKGYVKREQAIPYIAGANITTLADTLVAAMITGKAVAVQVVLAEAIGVSIVTLLLLTFLYGPLSRGIIKLDDWVVGTNRRLFLFVGVIFVLPAVLLFSGLFVGPVMQ